MNKEAVTIVVYDKRTGLMLATHRKDDCTKWGMPGGKIDPGESALEAVIRELGEETPYTALINNIEYLGMFPCNGEVYYDVHTFLVPDPSKLMINLSLKGIEQNYAWVNPKLLTSGPFADFNSKLFNQYQDRIFGLNNSNVVNNKRYFDNMPDEFPEDYEVN